MTTLIKIALAMVFLVAFAVIGAAKFIDVAQASNAAIVNSITK